MWYTGADLTEGDMTLNASGDDNEREEGELVDLGSVIHVNAIAETDVQARRSSQDLYQIR